jgi:TonB family protein
MCCRSSILSRNKRPKTKDKDIEHKKNLPAAEDLKELDSTFHTVEGAVRSYCEEVSEPPLIEREIAGGKILSRPTMQPSPVAMPAFSLVPSAAMLRWLVFSLIIALAFLSGLHWNLQKARNSAFHVSRIQRELPAGETLESQVVGATVKPAPQSNKKAVTEQTPPREDIATLGALVIHKNGKLIYKEGPTRETEQLSNQMSAQESGGDKVVAADSRPQSQPVAASENSAIDSTKPDSAALPDITTGRLIHGISPEYPTEAATQRSQGTVLVHGIVGQDGVIHQARVVRGDAVFTKATLDAIQQWRYVPYRINGQPIDMPIDIVIQFKLHK